MGSIIKLSLRINSHRIAPKASAQPTPSSFSVDVCAKLNNRALIVIRQIRLLTAGVRLIAGSLQPLQAPWTNPGFN